MVKVNKSVVFILFVLSGCANINEPKFEGKPLFDTNELHCPKDTFKYCEGRFKSSLDCYCVYKNMFDYL